MKKVLYVITSPAHKRVFESFVERSDLEQVVIGPAPVKSKYVPEDYSDFKIRNIEYYSNNNDPADSITKLMKKFKPDLYVQADLIPMHKKIHNSNMKKIYVSHGMVGNHVKKYVKSVGLNISVWRGFDLYCGASNIFLEWLNYAAGVGEDKVLLNAIPQLDLIYDPNYYNSYRNKIISKTRCASPKKVLLFLGFCCKDSADFIQHNEDYFRTAIELGKIAQRHNWLILIKPRHTNDEMMKFLKTHSWGRKYINEYKELFSNNNVHFIEAASAHIYRYYFADAFIINGCSTVEVEACAIKKPLFVVRTNLQCLQSNYDPYDVVSSGAAMPIPDMAELEHDLLEHFNDGKFHWPDKQDKLINKMGISFDGKMHERIQNKLTTM